MLSIFKRKKMCNRLLMGGALLAAGISVFSCKDKYDLDSDSNQPSNLNNIYSYLEEQGNYTNYLRLIDDNGMKQLLSKTGSKTMFAADDEAFIRFFHSKKSGTWEHVKGYEDLSQVQKALLLNASMIDNPYSTSMLATAEGPVKGQVCRRVSSQTLYDSVLVVASNSPEADKNLPKNKLFEQIRATHDSIVLFTDASTAPPMVHFTYKFLASNKLESADVDFLYNAQEGTRKIDDVHVNGAKVVEANIFCKNGFIHKVDQVITPLDNMAQIIRQDSLTTIYSSILDRYASPDSTLSLTNKYNEVFNKTSQDVFSLNYFSEKSEGSTSQTKMEYATDKNGNPAESKLKFDPGWNGYISESDDPREGIQENMAVMLVPSDNAFKTWWQPGNPLYDMYDGKLEDVPTETLTPLLNVNMLPSLTSALPSHFEEVLNDAKENLGLTKEKVDHVTVGCNGAVYRTNVLFAPTSYVSVMFPTVVDQENFSIISTAIKCMDYDAYLNSMVAKYIFLIPTNKGMLSYVDPVSYGRTQSVLWEFHYDATKAEEKRIYADLYNCTLIDGEWVKDGAKITTIKDKDIRYFNNGSGVGETPLRNRLENLLDNIIVTTDYQNGQAFYKTKGNTYVKIENSQPGSDKIQLDSKVYGGLQREFDAPLNVIGTYEGIRNGTALKLDGPIMGTRKTVAMTLNEYPEFSDFLGILSICGALNSQDSKDKWAAPVQDESLGNLFNLKDYGTIGAEDKPSGSTATKKATYLLNNYHYTMYVPTNEAMKIAYAEPYNLPTVEDVYDAEEWDRMYDELADSLKEALVREKHCCKGDSAARLKEVMLDFVKYHIQENSVYVDGAPLSESYESGKTELIASTQSDDYGNITLTGKYSPGRPYKIKVERTGSGMQVYDICSSSPRTVDSKLRNLQAQEYWISSASGTSGKVMTATDKTYEFYLDNSSSVVIHAIDGPLIYADGKHTDAKGSIVPTQFKYTYKPLSNDANANIRR